MIYEPGCLYQFKLLRSCKIKLFLLFFSCFVVLCCSVHMIDSQKMYTFAKMVKMKFSVEIFHRHVFCTWGFFIPLTFFSSLYLMLDTLLCDDTIRNDTTQHKIHLYFPQFMFVYALTCEKE